MKAQRTGASHIGMRLAAALLAGTAITPIAAIPTHAQEAGASLRGTITGVEASQVTAIEVGTGYRRTVEVGPDGSYNFASLRATTYRLEIVTPNGVRPTGEFTLTIGQNAELNFDLSAPAAPEAVDATPGGVTEEGGEIVITAREIQSMEGGEIGVNITQRMIEQLPQNNRNFLAFADLAPGVQFITNANGQTNIQGGAQVASTVNVFIDGVGQKDYVLKNGITGQDSTKGNPFPQSAIAEYRVISQNYKAEFAQVSSVAVTAVTKSGTNEFHGDAFIDFSNQDLRAKRPLEEESGDPKIETQDLQYGVSLGGPIIEDKLHFFVTYEGKRIQAPVEVTPGGDYTVADFPAEYQGNFGTFHETFNEDLYFGKVDFVPTSRDLFELSVKYRDETGIDFGGGRLAKSTSVDINTKDLRGLFRYERTEDNWINDFKITYEDASWAPTPRVFDDGRRFYSNTGEVLLRIGGAINFQDKGQKGWSVEDDFTWVGFTGHTIKAGVKAKWVTLHTETLNFTVPLYHYNVECDVECDLPAGTFNDQIPYRVEFASLNPDANPIVESDNFQLGLYIQDDWDVTDRLTLNIGVRWDYEETPSYLDYVTPQASVEAVSPENYPNIYNANAGYNINDFLSNGSEREPFLGAFQPRIGFSYELDEAGRFTLFGGYGRSYDRNQFEFIQQEISAGSFPRRDFHFTDAGDPAQRDCTPGLRCVPFDPIYLTPEGRDILAARLSDNRALRFINNDLKMPYSDQFSLGVRGRFGLLDAEMGYSHVESHDGFAYLLGNRYPDGNFFPLVDSDDPGNAPDTRAVFGGNFGQGPDGRDIIIGVNGIETSADSAYVKLVKTYTPTSPWSITATYTFTLAEENRKFGEYFSFDYPSIDDYPVLRSAGVSKHRFVAAGSVDLPLDFTLSGKLLLESPPYIYGIGKPGDPPRLGVPRTIEGKNKHPFLFGDLWATRQLDLALTKYIPFDFLREGARMRLRVDVLNVLNEENFVNYNGNGRSEDFGEINGLGVGGYPPRTFKLSAGFSF